MRKRNREARKSKELQRIFLFNEEWTRITFVSEMVTDDNESTEKQQCSLAEEAHQPRASNIQA